MSASNQLDLFTKIIDETEQEVIPFRYEITSYGADYPVDGIISRLNKGAIFVPPFQRRYVWNKYEASKFIESLLLGLPVPGVFLSKEKEKKTLLIVDGQQRLLSLQYFYRNKFKDGTEFQLVGVQDDLEGRSYDDLDEPDKNRLDDSIIHATVVKQDEPEDDDSSVYQLFERINSGGRPLSSQEIRACIYYGTYNELLVNLTSNSDWRSVIGGEHNERLKEEELILRFFSLFFHHREYKKPMKAFLNKRMSLNRNFEIISKDTLSDLFTTTIKFINDSLGDKAFRLERGVHSAIFDSVMVGTANRIRTGMITDSSGYIKIYEELLENKDYVQAYNRATSDEVSVNKRISIAAKEFSKVN